MYYIYILFVFYNNVGEKKFCKFYINIYFNKINILIICFIFIYQNEGSFFSFSDLFLVQDYLFLVKDYNFINRLFLKTNGLCSLDIVIVIYCY